MESHRRGSINTLALVASALAATGALYYSSISSTTASKKMKPIPAAPMVSKKLEVSPARLLKDAGFFPETLAAVGATAEQVSALVAAGRTHIAQNGEAYQQARQDEREARQRVSDLEQLAVSGRATEQQLASLASARQTLTSARSAVVTARAALFTAAAAGLSANQRGLLQNIAAAKSEGWELPLPFLVTVRSEADRLAIRDALAESRIVQLDGGEVSQTSLDVLSHAREDAPTSQAETDLANRAAAATSAWTEALQ